MEALYNNQTEQPAELVSWLEKTLENVENGLEHMRSFIARYEKMTEWVYQVSQQVEFAPLYEKKRQLFSIGFNLDDNRMTTSYYDLLASEARQTSYIAIARGEIPVKHWYTLGRSLTVVDRYKGLVSCQNKSGIKNL